eukprot:jgi/Astpho2/6152/Aster-03568
MDPIARCCGRAGLTPDQGKWMLLAGSIIFPLAYFTLKDGNQKQSPSRNINSFFRDPTVAAAAPQNTAKQQQPNGKTSGSSFNSFLRTAPASAKRDATSFSAFLKGSAGQQLSSTGPGQGDSAVKAPEGPRPDQAVVLVLFGTEYGFSKEVAERLCSELGCLDDGLYWAVCSEEFGNSYQISGSQPYSLTLVCLCLRPKLVDMADCPEGCDLAGEQLVLAACSTQGDGVAPAEAREFCDWLQSVAAPKLQGTAFAVCALGDRSYTHFCACGKMLDARLEELGGRRIAARIDVHREDWPAIEAWLDTVLKQVPILSLQTVACRGGAPAGSAPAATPKPKVWGKKRPFPAAVVAREGLCHISSKEDNKDTVRVELDLGDSGLQYTPGDALGIYPTNCPEAVAELLQLLGEDPKQHVPVPKWHVPSVLTADSQQATTMPLEQALIQCYDLRCPKPALLQAMRDVVPGQLRSPSGASSQASTDDLEEGPTKGPLSPMAGLSSSTDSLSTATSAAATAGAPAGEMQAQQLQAVLEGDVDAWLEERHLVDVVQALPALRLPLPRLLEHLRQLQPRLYSISSSQLENPARVQVTVAVVKYRSLSRERTGVTSTLLAERLQVGHKVPVYIHKNPDFRLPRSRSCPIIMVGPGTGLAPFRAFIQERLLQPGEQPGEAVLYFGCRRSDQDFLYAQQLTGWAEQGVLTLFTAFSRQQSHKVYVQDRLAESSALVWRLLQQGAHFYICGDAAHMAGSVERALLSILQQSCNGSLQQAWDYLNQLERHGRYQKDVWF